MILVILGEIVIKGEIRHGSQFPFPLQSHSIRGVQRFPAALSFPRRCKAMQHYHIIPSPKLGLSCKAACHDTILKSPLTLAGELIRAGGAFDVSNRPGIDYHLYACSFIA